VNRPVNNVIRKDQVKTLIDILSETDGVNYSDYTILRLSRPAICLSAEDGQQRVVAMETAYTIIKEHTHA